MRLGKRHIALLGPPVLFDVQAALTEIMASETATLATSATRQLGTGTVSQVSRVSQGHRADITPPPRVISLSQPHSVPSAAQDEGDACRQVRSLGNRRRTWTGRVVSLDEWRKLSFWDRHGPDGRLYCGICRSWVENCAHCTGCNP